MYKSWKEFKPVWLKALRSGAYRQGKGNLCSEGRTFDRFCCLGVAYDLLVQQGQGEWRQSVGDFERGLRAGSHIKSDNCMLTPVAIPKWFRTVLEKIPAGVPRHGDVEDTLAHLNDNGIKFKDIANWIEEKL